jgi:Tfp pilus assembly protein PilF
MALLFLMLPACALQVEYDDYYVDYDLIDFVQMEREADTFFLEAADKKAGRDQLLDAAQSRYYELAEYDMGNVKYPVQLARIYDYKKQDRLAKGYFFRALNLEKDNAYTNLYFGDFYFNRTDYKRALSRYLTAHKNGLQNKYDLNYNIAVIYEKFGDLTSAQKYYSACAAAMPNSQELKSKIDSIKTLDYGNSEYYYIIRK